MKLGIIDEIKKLTTLNQTNSEEIPIPDSLKPKKVVVDNVKFYFSELFNQEMTLNITKGILTLADGVQFDCIELMDWKEYNVSKETILFIYELKKRLKARHFFPQVEQIDDKCRFKNNSFDYGN